MKQGFIREEIINKFNSMFLEVAKYYDLSHIIEVESSYKFYIIDNKVFEYSDSDYYNIDDTGDTFVKFLLLDYKYFAPLYKFMFAIFAKGSKGLKKEHFIEVNKNMAELRRNKNG